MPVNEQYNEVLVVTFRAIRTPRKERKTVVQNLFKQRHREIEDLANLSFCQVWIKERRWRPSRQ